VRKKNGKKNKDIIKMVFESKSFIFRDPESNPNLMITLKFENFEDLKKLYPAAKEESGNYLLYMLCIGELFGQTNLSQIESIQEDYDCYELESENFVNIHKNINLPYEEINNLFEYAKTKIESYKI